MATGVGTCCSCRVLVKNLKGSEFNVPESETARLGNIFMSIFFFKERNGPPKCYGFIRGCPLAGNNNGTFCIYTGAF